MRLYTPQQSNRMPTQGRPLNEEVRFSGVSWPLRLEMSTMSSENSVTLSISASVVRSLKDGPVRCRPRAGRAAATAGQRHIARVRYCSMDSRVAVQ